MIGIWSVGIGVAASLSDGLLTIHSFRCIPCGSNTVIMLHRIFFHSSRTVYTAEDTYPTLPHPYEAYCLTLLCAIRSKVDRKKILLLLLSESGFRAIFGGSFCRTPEPGHARTNPTSSVSCSASADMRACIAAPLPLG